LNPHGFYWNAGFPGERDDAPFNSLRASVRSKTGNRLIDPQHRTAIHQYLAGRGNLFLGNILLTFRFIVRPGSRLLLVHYRQSTARLHQANDEHDANIDNQSLHRATLPVTLSISPNGGMLRAASYL
jgi:hypothetical protein